MTALTAIQNISAKIGLAKPTAVFSSSDRELFELQVLMNEVALEISNRYEWQKLKRLATITGDAVASTFSLPSDYGGMLTTSALWSTRLQAPLRHIVDTDEWLQLTIRQFQTVVGVWTLFGNLINTQPVPTATELIYYYYRSNLIATDVGLTNRETITADTDVFRLSQPVLEKFMIYRWKQNKGTPYAEEMEDAEAALDREITKDKGSKILMIGSPRYSSGARVAYPEAIVP